MKQGRNDASRPTVVFDKRIMHSIGQTQFVLYRNDCSSLVASPLSACRPPSIVDNRGSRKMENLSRAYPPGALSRTPLSSSQTVCRLSSKSTAELYGSIPVQVPRLMSGLKSTRHLGIFHSRLCRIRTCPLDLRRCQTR